MPLGTHQQLAVARLMNIAFNINRLALIGLGATLTSLVRNCSNSKELKLSFLCSNLRDSDKANINALLEAECFQGTVEYIHFDAKAIFGHLPSLHGDWTAYGRLLIPSRIASASCLYLDSDIIVQLDVLAIKEFSFNGRLLAATYGCTIADSLDKPFFIEKLKWSQQTHYFNSGVVLFNIDKWLENDIENQWTSLSNKYRKSLISHDQTILNAVCGGAFSYLSPNFNTAWYPVEARPQNCGNSILHFVGSPKPWDFFGSILHKGYETWQMYNDDQWVKKYSRISFQKIRRGWNIRWSIVRSALKMQKIKQRHQP